MSPQNELINDMNIKFNNISPSGKGIRNTK